MAEHDHTHIDPAEAAQADDPNVGTGTPDSAPDELLIDVGWKEPTNWIPSRKWLAATVVAVTGLLTTWATTGSWDQEETLMAITIVSARLVAYLIPNE